MRYGLFHISPPGQARSKTWDSPAVQLAHRQDSFRECRLVPMVDTSMLCFHAHLTLTVPEGNTLGKVSEFSTDFSGCPVTRPLECRYNMPEIARTGIERTENDEQYQRRHSEFCSESSAELYRRKSSGEHPQADGSGGPFVPRWMV